MANKCEKCGRENDDEVCCSGYWNMESWWYPMYGMMRQLQAANSIKAKST